MRFAVLSCILLALAGTSAAQDTNFSAGPQYLITGSSPMFLHSIATPTLSLSTPLPSPTASENEPLSQTPPSAGLPPQADLSRIYWGGSESAEPGTGRVSENAAESVSQNTTESLAGNASEQKDVNKNVSEINITSALSPSVLPTSILDTGVTGMTSAQSLRERGFGIPLGDTAAFWKTHKLPAPRIYTNADVQRLHQG